MEDAPAPLPEEIEAARLRGYWKGVNLGLLTISFPCGLLAAIRFLAGAPKFEEVFRQVKVPMPALTELILNTHMIVGWGFLAGLAVCAFVTRRWGERKRVALANGGYVFLCIASSALYALAMEAPMISLLEGLGQRRH